jgi:hypothetical protein
MAAYLGFYVLKVLTTGALSKVVQLEYDDIK